MPRDAGQLGQLREAGQRTGGIHDHARDAAAYRLVGDLAEQDGLAGAEATDHGDEPGGLADLGGVVGVEHDGPPRRAGGVADVRPAPVAHLARGGREAGGDVQHGQASPVRCGGDRLAGDELAEQAVLAARVLDGDPAVAVRRDDLADALEALLLGGPGDREPEPAVRAGSHDVGASAHLVLDLAGVDGLTVEGQRLVEVVLGVVPLHVAYDEKLALDGLTGFPTRQDIELRGPLHGERQPVGVRQPGVVTRVVERRSPRAGRRS